MHKITDKQIAQINKAKMLPPNARFEKLYSWGGRNGMLREPVYRIMLHVPIIPKINEHSRTLPEGYQVVKLIQGGRLNGFLGAVKIEKNSF